MLKTTETGKEIAENAAPEVPAAGASEKMVLHISAISEPLCADLRVLNSFFESLAEVSAEVREEFLGIVEGCTDRLTHLNIDSALTAGTNELVIRLQSSKLLADFAAAIRASDGDLAVLKNVLLDHVNSPAVGCGKATIGEGGADVTIRPATFGGEAC